MDYRYIGKNLPKKDALLKSLGKAEYINDISFPKMLYGKILRSPFSHAQIKSIDVSKAMNAPGLKAVITAADLPKARFGSFIKDEPVLARDKVRYIGEPIAAVAATDIDAAEEALTLIKVEYMKLPAVFDPIEAMKSGAPIIHEKLGEYSCIWEAIQKGNVCSKTTICDGDLAKGFNESDLIVEKTFKTQMVHQAYLEPSGAIAKMDPGGKLTIWSSTQGIFVTQARISESLKIPMARIRVIAPHIGGAFGGKVEPHVEPICAALSQKTDRPVKIVLTRDEEFSSTRPRPPAIVTCKLGLKSSGLFKAKKMYCVYDSGAYAAEGPGVAAFGALMGRGPYRVPNLSLESYCVYTNKVKTGAYRGFGNPQTTFASESLIDIAAKELRMDPLELRLKNAIDPGDKSVGSQVLHSVGIKECLQRVAQEINWEHRPLKTKNNKRYIGKGISSINHISGLMNGSAIVRIDEDGSVVLAFGNIDIGQGSDTILSQICAEELGVSVEDINLLKNDTDSTPYTWTTTASRTTWTAGNAVRNAALDAKRKIINIAAQQLKEDPSNLKVDDRKVFVKNNPERALTFRELATMSCYHKGGPVIGRNSFQLEVPAFDSKVFKGFPFGTMTAYIFGAHAVEVEVDIDTAQVKILRAVAAHDVGHAINPQNVEGQIEGGFVQGIGYTLTEELSLEGGRVNNLSFDSYKILSSLDAPTIKTIIVESIDNSGPFGAKGVGEAGQVGVAPAVANAVYDAIGFRITELPISSEKILDESI